MRIRLRRRTTDPRPTPPLVAEVTADARAELQLVPGTELYLLIKTTAITLYEDAPAE